MRLQTILEDLKGEREMEEVTADQLVKYAHRSTVTLGGVLVLLRF